MQKLTEPTPAPQLREGMLGKIIQQYDANTDLKGRHVILGFPDDRGVKNNLGKVGASQGPEAFRAALYTLYSPQSAADVVDLGDIELADTIEQSHMNLAETLAEVLEQGADKVVVVGGGHDFSFGSYLGHYKAQRGHYLPILNLDAHLDLRPHSEGEPLGSGTPFWRILEVPELHEALAGGEMLLEMGIQRERNSEALYKFAMENKIPLVLFDALSREWEPLQKIPHALKSESHPPSIKSFLQDVTEKLSHSDSPIGEAFKNVSKNLYRNPLDIFDKYEEYWESLGWNPQKDGLHLSLDLDVFASHLAPGTSAATPLGCTLENIGPLWKKLCTQNHIRVLDIAELCPKRDSNDTTSKLAASLALAYLNG